MKPRTLPAVLSPEEAVHFPGCGDCSNHGKHRVILPPDLIWMWQWQPQPNQTDTVPRQRPP
jgi:hypothetical protein